jgi:predicted nucleic acid-binding Zn ribbon protein
MGSESESSGDDSRAMAEDARAKAEAASRPQVECIRCGDVGYGVPPAFHSPYYGLCGVLFPREHRHAGKRCFGSDKPAIWRNPPLSYEDPLADDEPEPAIESPPPESQAFSEIELSVCEHCGVKFEPYDATQRFCGNECREIASEFCPPEQRVKTCLLCGREFKAKGLAKRCELCRGTTPKGYYVYAWLDAGAVFYIGIGQGERVTTRHTIGNMDSPCEQWIGVRFAARIVRDNLTDEGARLIESVLINAIRPACNSAKGHKRVDRPPLTLPRDALFGDR